jgi:hypothetical protein
LLVEKDTARRYWFDANPLLDDNFSTDNWTDSGANVSISSGVMNFDIDRTTTDQSSYYQLSRALSDTKWTMRLHDVIVTTKSGGVEVFIGVSSNTSGAQTAQDFIGLNLGDNTANPVLGGVDSDGAVIARLAGDYTYSLSTTYNIEIIRESATSYRIKVFSNSGFDSTALFSQSYTCTATTTGLQYVKFANGQVAGSTENIIGTCSKMEIFDGVTTASGGGQWTMQPTFEDDFSTNKGWVENSGNSSVNTTTGKLDFNLSAVSGSDNGIVYDLGAGNVSDKFILRCKLHITTSVNNNNHRCWIGIGNSDQSIDESANQYFVGASLYDQAGSNGLNSNLANNTDLQTTFSSSSVYTWSDNTDQWLEITKTETNIICKIYSDSTYVTVSASADLSTAFTGSGTLRYIKLVNRGDVSGGTFTGTIDDIEFYNGVTSIN